MKIRCSAFLFSLIIAHFNFAQTTYQNIDLGIANIPQENTLWCWAAVSQQIIYWQKGSAPRQCELVSIANNVSSGYCCYYPQQCNVAGSNLQIQNLILYYGGRYSSLQMPANAMVLQETLRQGRPIILQLKLTPYMGHVVVLRGINWVSTAYGLQPILLINDPMGYFTQPIPFENLLNFWSGAIVLE
ncbi:MAG TPA: hypothetical protein DCQ50_11135 [Chryseobacterium sp.]|nr:hypothetical protein [Chryseobacterium sp.]